ncbi:hypothetical protein BD410DRAFT_780653, partial [Rickenella mellea]
RRPPNADHLPIMSVIDISAVISDSTPRRNWRMTDWKAFREELSKRLATMPPMDIIRDVETLEAMVEFVQESIMATADQVVPMSTPTPFTKRWWTKELDEAR